jgi:hypothetical protein
MMSNQWKAWPAQSPSADFAERTLVALVRDRRGRFAWLGRRWFMAAAMAAVLIAGGAFGLMRFSSPRTPPSPGALPSAVTTRTTAEPPAIPAVRPAEPRTSEAPVSATPARRRLEAPAAGPPDAGRRVILPRCNCSPNEAICDCF